MNWFSDFKYNLEQSRNTKWLNSELEKRYYKPKSNSIIKILSEIEKKAGLSSFDIVPFLIKINLMPSKNSLIEEGSGGGVTDRKRNDELFKELEELGFIKIIDNKLYSKLFKGTYPTPVEDCILRVRLLPKGIDYLIEHKNKRFGKSINVIMVFFSACAFLISIYNLKKPTIEKYNKLENKIDSIVDIIGIQKEQQLKQEGK